MGLHLIADSPDDLPEGIRGTAVEKGGKWYAELGDHEVARVKDLKDALVEERSKVKKLGGLASSFGWKLAENGSEWASEGISSRQAHDALEKIKTGGVKGSEELEAHKQALTEKFQREREDLEGTLSSLRSQLHETLVDQKAAAAIQAYGGNVRLLLPVVKAAAKVDSDNAGKLVVSLHGEDGKPLITGKSGATDPMGFEEFVDGMRRDRQYAAAFQGPGAGGAGSTSQHAKAGTGSGGIDPTTLSSTELIQRANEKQAAGLRM